MGDDGVDHHRDQCPCLLGVPSPVGTPGKTRPYGARDYPRGEEGKTQGHAPVVDPVQGLQGGELIGKEEGPLSLDLFFYEEVENGYEETDDEYPVPQE